MKRLDKIDPNFYVDTTLPEGYEYFDAQGEPFSIYGIAPNDPGVYCRLPVSMLPQCSEGVQSLSWHMAGACVRFTTDSDGLCVLWELTDDQGIMSHFAVTGQSGLELFEETDLGTVQISQLRPKIDPGRSTRGKQSAFVKLRPGKRHYVLYLPLYNGIKQLTLGFAPGASIEPGRKPRIEKPLVFYGSSITQGGCASKVGSCYTTVLARRLDAAQLNLGFSGNAKGEEHMARYIASLDMSVFIMDYDYNANYPEFLDETHEPFFRIVRKAQPELPIILMSKPDFDADIEDSRKRRDIIIRTYANAVAAGDKNVYFIDGEQFFGARDRDMCTVDGCHPTDLGFLRMADTVEPVLRHILGI